MVFEVNVHPVIDVPGGLATLAIPLVQAHLSRIDQTLAHPRLVVAYTDELAGMTTSVERAPRGIHSQHHPTDEKDNVMDEQTSESPTLVELGEFSEDTLGGPVPFLPDQLGYGLP